jgi:nucleoid-associated protein YgaU
MMTSAADRTHQTRSGDTLESLALKYYGDPGKHADIANQADNKLVLKSTDPKKKLPKNLTLKIPGAVTGGYFIDHLAADPKAAPRTSKADKNVPQDYVWPGEEIPGKNEHGFKKKKNVKAASLKDFPGTNARWSFSFETAARSVDAGIYYGAIHWSFVVDGGKVSSETHRIAPGVSETFREALHEFNKFYKNKHVVMKGETLSSISQKYYGTPDKWEDIYKANKVRIKDPDHIEPGWELTIPGFSAE